MSDLRRRILEYVESHPGASTSAVRRAVSGKHARVTEALSALEETGEIRNDGNENRHSWHVRDRSRNGFLVRPREVPGSAPEAIEGVSVAGWMTPRAAAEVFDVTLRTLRRWERRGLPVWDPGGSEKLVPLPHALWWGVEYERVKRKNPRGVSGLPMKLAWARYNLRRVEDGEPPIYDLPAG